MTNPNDMKRTVIEKSVGSIKELLPRLHAKDPKAAEKIARDTLEDIRESGNLDLEPALMEVIQSLGIQVEEAIGKEVATEELTPQAVAEALRDLIEDDEFEDIQDSMGVAYAILMEIYGNDEDQVNTVLAEKGLTEPES